MSSQYQPWNSAMVYGENIQVAVGVNCASIGWLPPPLMVHKPGLCDACCLAE
jgi:hypothetical protein